MVARRCSWDTFGRMSECPSADSAGAVGVVYADDHAGYRSGMVEAIRAYEGLRFVGEYADGTSALEAIRRLQPAVAVLDYRMPGLDGLSVCRQVREAGVPTAVLVLSGMTDRALAAAAHAVGANAVLPKQTPRADICATLVRLGREVVAQNTDS